MREDCRFSFSLPKSHISSLISHVSLKSVNSDLISAMEKFLRILFSRHFFPERILLLSVSFGIIINGWLTGAFEHPSAELYLRITISLLSACAFIFTYSINASRRNVRQLAVGAI